MPGITSVLLDLFIIFALAKTVGEIFTRLKQPVLVGEILLGIIIGPNALGIVGVPAGALIEMFHGSEETAQEALAIVFEIMAEFGVIILLFFVGLETRVSDIVQVGRRASLVAFLGIAVPFIFGVFFILLIGRPQVEAIFVGAALVGTSTAIAARVLRDLGFMGSEIVRIIIGAAVIDDVLALLLLTIVTGLGEGDGIHPTEIVIISAQAIAMIAFVAFFGPRGARRYSLHIRRLRIPHGHLTVAIILTLGLATLSGRMGMAAIIGAFLAGMVLAESKEHFDFEQDAAPFYEFFVPFFFVLTGMKVDPKALFDLQVALISAAVIALAICGKVIGCGIAAWSLGPRNAAIVGVAMSPRGEVGLIAASVGLSLAAISAEIFSVVVVMSIVTALLAPPALVMLFHNYQLEEERAPARFPRVIRRPYTRRASPYLSKALDISEKTDDNYYQEDTSMSTQATSGDETWSKLADLSEEERQAAILERLNELASLPEDERVSKARAMAEAEYSLPDDKLRSFALSRLRTFLKMDPEDAKRIIATNDIDIVMRQMPGGIAMRRIMLLQTLAREFPPAEQEQLLTLAPQIFASQVTPPVPPRTPEAATPAAPERAAPASTATPTAPAKKPWWAFWQK